MTRVPVRITRKQRLTPAWAAAMVPWRRTIWVRAGVNVTPRLLAHELAHVTQAERCAWPLAYFVQWLATGRDYHAMPFEIEARAAESNPWYLAWAEDILRDRVV